MESTLWITVGASIQGSGHKTMNLPCQDAHLIETFKGSGIAIVSDGAGSSFESHKGSNFIVEQAMIKVKNLIEEKPLLDSQYSLSHEEWQNVSEKLIEELQEELRMHAKKYSIDFKCLSCTLIIVLFSHSRILLVHVGDGRAGYADEEGNWKSIMNPFKGEQVGQTVFLTSDIWTDSEKFIESRIIQDSISAIAVLSDGCETGCWKFYDKDPSKEFYYDPNIPDQAFFDQNCRALKSMYESRLDKKEVQRKWESFLISGNSEFIKEKDDKTMILAVKLNQES